MQHLKQSHYPNSKFKRGDDDDDDDLLVTSKRTTRDVSAETPFSDIKDEEEEEDRVEGVHGKAYGDLTSPYQKPFLSTRGTLPKFITASGE